MLEFVPDTDRWFVEFEKQLRQLPMWQSSESKLKNAFREHAQHRLTLNESLSRARVWITSEYQEYLAEDPPHSLCVVIEPGVAFDKRSRYVALLIGYGDRDAVGAGKVMFGESYVRLACDVIMVVEAGPLCVRPRRWRWPW